MAELDPEVEKIVIEARELKKYYKHRPALENIIFPQGSHFEDIDI